MTPRGGPREGSGPKKRLYGPRRLSVILDHDTISRLRKICETRGITRSAAIRDIVAREPIEREDDDSDQK